MAKPLPPPLARFVAALLALGMLSLVYTAVMTHRLHSPHPYGVTLFWHGFVGSDFTTFAERSRHFGTSSYWDEFNYPFTYPAPLGVVFAIFFRLPHPLAIYLAICVAGLALWGCWLARMLAARGVSQLRAIGFAAILLAASWPVVLLLNTANIEGFVAILLAAGVLAVLRERFWLGATLIGLAASMKLFPFILLALLISRRRWLDFAWGLAVAAMATLAGLKLLGPTILTAQHHVDAGLGFVQRAFILSTTRDALNYSHSLWSPLKFALTLAGRQTGHASAVPALLRAALRGYMAAASIGGITLYFAWIRRLPILNQVLALTVCAVLLPPLSADYTLLELLLPFALLCAYTAENCHPGESPRGLSAAFACFAVLFGWETFLTLRYSFDRPARTIALTILLGIVLRFPFAWPTLDAPEPKAPAGGAA
jgi:hypothetical protein